MLRRLVVPVGLVPTHDENAIAFKTLHEPCSRPISLTAYCGTCGCVVADDELVKGYEVAAGQYVRVTADELAAIAPNETGQSLTVTSFVPAEEVDPISFDSAYYLVPTQDLMLRHYALVARTLADTGTVAIARFVWRSEKLAAIRTLPGSAALALHTLKLPADLRSRDELEAKLDGLQVDVDELDLARELTTRLTVSIGGADLVSRQRARARALLEDKLAGRDLVQPDDGAEPETPIVEADLAQAIKASLRGLPKPRRRREPAKR